MSDTPQTPQPLKEKEEIDEIYANNTQFELSAFDLKIIFGQLDQRGGRTTVNWRTAITLPWVHAKVMLYYLQAQVAFYERVYHMPIVIPATAIPAKPVDEVPEEQKDPSLIEYVEFIKKLHSDMFGQ